MKLQLDRTEVLNLEYTLKKEYLLTNGKGGFCSSTILDCHTRKYHSLLVLPLESKGKMFSLLSKVEAAIVIEKKDFNLATNKFPGVFSPTGHQYVDKFEIEDFPITTYKIADIVLTKSILMPHGKESVMIKYELKSSPLPVTLKLQPLLSYREVHCLSHQNMHIRPRTFIEKLGFKIEPYEGMPPLFIETSEPPKYYPSPSWWDGFEYLKERNRGYEYQEDLFCPGIFEIKMKKGDVIIFRAKTSKSKESIEKEWDDEIKLLKEISTGLAKEKEPLKTLKKSAEHYVFEYPETGQPGIKAGFHWYDEQGRDTLLSIAGLLLCKQDSKTALSILKRFSKYEKNGSMPNLISLNGILDYHNADVSLLFFLAIQNFINMTGDKKAVEKDLLKTLINIISSILNNKTPYCEVRGDGLLYAGDESTRLTWMNATAFGRPVTSRHGAAVEINALWYNALKFIKTEFAKGIEPNLLKKIDQAITLFECNFMKCFWNDAELCLFDVYRSESDRDGSIRPNQLFAAGLPFSCVDPSRIVKIIDAVNTHLLTPFGLRSLSPKHELYQPLYSGTEDKRESCAHQGMAWPWLIGIYCDTLLKLYPNKIVKTHIEDSFHNVYQEHLERYGLFHISEMYTPNPPHIAKGTMGQAKNMAEIIRTLTILSK